MPHKKPQPFNFRPLHLAAAVLAAAALSWVQIASAHPHSFAADDAGGQEPLPELGDSAGRVLTKSAEEQIGKQFLRQMLGDARRIDDPELNAYLNGLGAEVGEHPSVHGQPVYIHLLDNPELNAFAVPGGHITFNSGLILRTDDESELAAVMSHEIAHVSQRHLPRLLAKTESGKLPAAAAILASVLVGGQVGVAGLTVTNAALLSNQLSYTREFEREADAIGIKLLAASGYDPNAMARFFVKLDRPGDLGELSSGEPRDYLRTHPLSYARIAAAEDRAGAYPPREYPPSRKFFFAREKIRALYMPRVEDVINYYKLLVADADSAGDESELSSVEKDAAIYGLALALSRDRQYKEARATLKRLLDVHPNDLALNLARAEIDLAAGDAEDAAVRLGAVAKAYPQLPYLTDYQAEALLAAGDADEAKRVIRHRLRRDKERYTLYPLLSKVNGELGQSAEGHQATAEYHAILGDYPSALASLQNALGEAGEEGYLRESIESRIKEVEERIPGAAE